MLLAVHGMTSSRRSWERLARDLDGRYRLAAYDQRGHGDSADITGPMALEQGVRDAAGVAAALGEPIAALLGHSWGGAVAILAGLRLPVARVATIDPMIRQASDGWYEEYLDELRASFEHTGAQRESQTRQEFADWAPLDVEGKVHAIRTMTAAPIEGLWKENPAPAWDLRETIASYEKPLLLALASPGESINEDATLAEIAERRAACVEIVTFPGAGHNLHRTAFAQFAGAFSDWLAR